ncbi:LytR/AlgR family response regulator transcription factor [Acanthopleuribacter pedis]|uniref:Response regulator n=1 Tax=Acanthopleuribacter pedis TaxID=442870 RepID=A0A8J7Q2K0_9BACT|nr:response regulator [Acanthopleuribacter pedis]MBO1317484.1 response regulator [Acanthopleuribacter pedis]
MADRIRAVIVDDEKPARRNLTHLLGAETDIDLVAECANGLEALAAVEEHRPDLMFLDIQMPQITGFDVLRRIEDAHMPTIIFVTAYDAFAVKAFEVNALDYLLKPFDDQRFQQALARARERIHGDRGGDETALMRQLLTRLEAKTETAREAPQAKPEPLTRFMVKQDERYFFVRVEDVAWLCSAGNYVALHQDGKEHLVRGTLTETARRLGPGFLRISRTHIINVDAVQVFEPQFNGEYVAVMRDGATLTMSRKYKQIWGKLFPGR